MSDKLCKRSIPGNKQQEIIMKDVLGGLEEIAIMLSYDPWPGDFEIIAIYPPNEKDNPSSLEETVVKSHLTESRPKADIICYQRIKSRLLKSA